MNTFGGLLFNSSRVSARLKYQRGRCSSEQQSPLQCTEGFWRVRERGRCRAAAGSGRPVPPAAALPRPGGSSRSWAETAEGLLGNGILTLPYIFLQKYTKI